MPIISHFPVAVRSAQICLLLIAVTAPARAEFYLDHAEKWRLFGDLRGRMEADFDSRNETGEERGDRDRLRYRLRLGLQYRSTEHWRMQFRARTTRESGQQSSALTLEDFSGGPDDDFRLFPDQWFMEYSAPDKNFWLGRNTFPFWQANTQEMIWADNATLMGAFAAFETGKDINANLRAGYFGLPDGMYDAGGRMAAIQTGLTLNPAPAWWIRAAAGMLAINGSNNSRYLIDGNGERDYRTGMLSGEIRKEIGMQSGPDFLGIGLDLLHNFATYAGDDPDPISAAFRNERSGLVLSLVTGINPNKTGGSRWELGYVYAYIEKLAINAAYGQSDWVRWGGNGQTQSSDLKGHGFSGRYWFSDDLDVRARLYLVESIATQQDGNRFRIDVNYRF